MESLRREYRLHLVEIAPHEGSDPKSVVSAAKEINKVRDKQVADHERDDPFDEVWVVFDTEGPQSHRLDLARHAVEQARQLEFLTAVSNPSFEYWLLLHFEWTLATFADGASVKKRLKKHLPNYDKGEDAFEATKRLLPEASKNAKQVFRDRPAPEGDNPCDVHPCTQFYRLIDSLIGK